MIDLVDLTRGLNSLALWEWYRGKSKEFYNIRCFSGYGEPEWIPWGKIVKSEVVHLAKGWTCGGCGYERNLKVRRNCPECHAPSHVQEPIRVDWGGIHGWKEQNGRLTFRYSAHPF